MAAEFEKEMDSKDAGSDSESDSKSPELNSESDSKNPELNSESNSKNSELNSESDSKNPESDSESKSSSEPEHKFYTRTYAMDPGRSYTELPKIAQVLESYLSKKEEHFAINIAFSKEDLENYRAKTWLAIEKKNLLDPNPVDERKDSGILEEMIEKQMAIDPLKIERMEQNVIRQEKV